MIQTVNNNVLVRFEKLKETPGGIILPDNYKEYGATNEAVYAKVVEGSPYLQGETVWFIFEESVKLTDDLYVIPADKILATNKG
jgi:hypothetical protein